jgi:ubiquinone/menaquinone biosynthesis C-methylase UbiE
MKKFEEYSKEHVHLYEIGEIFPLLKNSILDLRKNKKKINIIDLGCGDGNLLNQLFNENIIKKEDNIYALDPSQTRLNRIKNPLFRKVLAFGDNTKLKKNYFDYVICTQVIEHVENDNTLLKEIKRITKKDGYSFISSVVKKPYGIYIYKNKYGKMVSDPTHEREYKSKQEYENLLNSYFKIEKTNMHVFKFPVTDLIIKLLIRIKLINPEKVIDIYLKSKLLRFLKKIRVSLIGFYYIESLVKKTS